MSTDNPRDAVVEAARVLEVALLKQYPQMSGESFRAWGRLRAALAAYDAAPVLVEGAAAERAAIVALLSGLRERLAKAMFEDEPAYKDSFGPRKRNWNDVTYSNDHYWLKRADAAISVLRDAIERGEHAGPEARND